MNLKFKTIVLITGILLSSIAAFGQEGSSEKKESKTEISLEIDMPLFSLRVMDFISVSSPKIANTFYLEQELMLWIFQVFWSI